MGGPWRSRWRSEEHTSELQSRLHLVCRLLLEKKKKKKTKNQKKKKKQYKKKKKKNKMSCTLRAFMIGTPGTTAAIMRMARTSTNTLTNVESGMQGVYYRT